MKVGYIGLGLMGRPCALNLYQAGYELVLYARREQSLAPFIDKAEICQTPAEVAENSEVIFTNLSDTPDVEQVILGAKGIIHGAKPDAVVIDMSTISPVATKQIAQRLKEKHIHMLDAPVSGGSLGAEQASLSIMVGGDEQIVERILPLFNVLGSHVTHLGGHGAGQVTKACNQILITQSILGVAEAFSMADKMGVDKTRVQEALMGGFAKSRVLELHGQRMINKDYAPGFKAALHKKDMTMILQAAGQLGLALPGTAQATQWLNALVGQGNEEWDSAAIYEVINKINA